MAYNVKTGKVIVPVLNDLDVAAADVWIETIQTAILLHKVEFVMSEATDGAVATNAVLSVDVINKLNPSRTEILTGTVPSVAPRGLTVDLVNASNQFQPIELREGDTVYFERKVAQTATEVGAGYFIYYCELMGDIPLTDD